MSTHTAHCFSCGDRMPCEWGHKWIVGGDMKKRFAGQILQCRKCKAPVDLKTCEASK